MSLAVSDFPFFRISAYAAGLRGLVFDCEPYLSEASLLAKMSSTYPPPLEHFLPPSPYRLGNFGLA
jgi:hypothetical protein